MRFIAWPTSAWSWCGSSREEIDNSRNHCVVVPLPGVSAVNSANGQWAMVEFSVPVDLAGLAPAHATLSSQAQPQQLPKMLAVDDGHGGPCRVEAIEQARVDPDPACCPVPAAISLKSGTVGVRTTTTHWAKMMRREFCVSAVHRVIGCWRRDLERRRFVISTKCTALGTERASASG